MRGKASARWILRGVITCVLVIFYAQAAPTQSQQCKERQYSKGSRCCNKCEPGTKLLYHCSDSKNTVCVKCNHDEYQPNWTENTSCFRQKYCDTGKGFMESKENLQAEEPCRCKRGLQCYHIDCEFCEKLPTCEPGYGLQNESGSTLGRRICAPCPNGFFSSRRHSEQCKAWTNCKAEGRSETQAGSSKADVVCGPPVSGATPPWVLISFLSVTIVLFLLLLRIFCYKDKLKLLSINLRSCVQNLKRTRIQQDTLAPLYHNGAATPGPRVSPCEVTKLIGQVPHLPDDNPPCTLSSSSDTSPSTSATEEAAEKEELDENFGSEKKNGGSGEPQEVSEEETAFPLVPGSCGCGTAVCEPVEVGENEDCSQAVYPGTVGNCCCGTLETEKDGELRTDRGDGKRVNSSALNPPHTLPLHTCSDLPPLSPSSDLHMERSRSALTDQSPAQTEGLYRQTVSDCSSTGYSTSSTVTCASNFSPDRPPETSCPEEQSLRTSFGNTIGNKLHQGLSESDGMPESLHSQLAEPTPTSGQVSGNNNTTFISSGQVLNFSGEVIVVCVSPTSPDSEQHREGQSIRSPVQEEASETALFTQSRRRSHGDCSSWKNVQDEIISVQEETQKTAKR